MVPELVRTWASGWAVSRRTPRPVEHPWGVYIEVGSPTRWGAMCCPTSMSPRYAGPPPL